MATVTKDFRIKSGLVVEGANATVDGSDIITEDALTGGTQTNITVTYDAQTKTVNFVAENGIADSTTDDLAEGEDNRYFTDQRALDATASAYDPAGAAAAAEQNANDYTDTAIGNISSTLDISSDSGTDSITLGSETLTFTGGAGVDTSISSNAVTITVDAGNGISTSNGDVAVDMPYVAQNIFGTGNPSGLEFDGGSQKLKVNPGSGIELTSEGVSVNTGAGLKFDNSDQLAVNTGYGLTIQMSPFGDTVAVDKSTLASDLAGSGLELDGGSLDIRVKTGNGLSTNNSTNALQVDLANDSGLEFITGDLKVHAGNYITVDNGGVNVNKNSLAGDLVGDGLYFDSMFSPTISVKTDDATVQLDTNGDLSVKYGNGLTVESSELVVDTSVIATKSYVDAVAEGLHIHASAAVATTANIADLSDGPGTVDGVALNDTLDVYTRVLVKSQTTTSQNGIYVATRTGFGKWVYTRALDFDSPSEVDGGDFVFVTEGTLYNNTGWVQTTAGVTVIGTDPIEFTQFSGAGVFSAGNGLELNGSEFSIDDTVVVTHDDLDTYLNSTSGSEGTTILYVQDYVATAIETGDATATPTYLALDVNSLIKYEAAEQIASHGDPEFPYFLHSFSPSEYKSAKYIVKASRGTHTEVSEVLVTLDTSNNIAITEYAVVGTNGSLATISASLEYGLVNLTAVATADGTTTYTTVATLIK